MNKFIKNKWMRWILIPLVLLGVWFGLTLWYVANFDTSFLVISYNHPSTDFIKITHDKLMKGDKLIGQFKAVEDNLGIVALRFKSFQRVEYKDEDALVFRLKEKGSKEWYYQNKYRSGFIYDTPFLPFGFPLIHDSKGKIYIFELGSLKGNQNNGVALSERSPFFQSKYQENKAALFSDKENFIIFVVKKFVNSLQTVDVLYSSIVFLLPLLFYLYWAFSIKTSLVDSANVYLSKKLERFGRRFFGRRYGSVFAAVRLVKLSFISITIIIGVLIDIIFLQVSNDLLYIVIPVLWSFSLHINKVDNKYSFYTGLFFLVLCPVYLYLDTTNIAESAGAWAFMFLLTGLLKEMVSTRKIYS